MQLQAPVVNRLSAGGGRPGATLQRNPQPFMNLLQTLLQKEAKVGAASVAGGPRAVRCGALTPASGAFGRARVQPTLAHYFLRLLAEKGLLQRVYTQNVRG